MTLYYDELAVRETFSDLFRKIIGKKRWSNLFVEKGVGFTLIRYQKNRPSFERKYKKYGWLMRYLTGNATDKKLSKDINKIVKDLKE